MALAIVTQIIGWVVQLSLAFLDDLISLLLLVISGFQLLNRNQIVYYQLVLKKKAHRFCSPYVKENR